MLKWDWTERLRFQTFLTLLQKFYSYPFFKTQLKCKLNICFDCSPLCFGTSEVFWLYHTWYFHISVSLLNPVGFLHSYCDLGMVIQWAEWLQCYCVQLGSSVVVSATFCILCGHISSQWGLHSAGASISHTNTHSCSCCHPFRERDKPQTATDDKASAKARRTVKAKLFWAEARISSKHYSSLFYPLMYPPLHWSPFLVNL